MKMGDGNRRRQTPETPPKTPQNEPGNVLDRSLNSNGTIGLHGQAAITPRDTPRDEQTNFNLSNEPPLDSSLGDDPHHSEKRGRRSSRKKHGGENRAGSGRSSSSQKSSGSQRSDGNKKTRPDGIRKNVQKKKKQWVPYDLAECQENWVPRKSVSPYKPVPRFREGSKNVTERGKTRGGAHFRECNSQIVQDTEMVKEEEMKIPNPAPWSKFEAVDARQFKDQGPGRPKALGGMDPSRVSANHTSLKKSGPGSRATSKSISPKRKRSISPTKSGRESPVMSESISPRKKRSRSPTKSRGSPRHGEETSSKQSPISSLSLSDDRLVATNVSASNVHFASNLLSGGMDGATDTPQSVPSPSSPPQPRTSPYPEQAPLLNQNTRGSRGGNSSSTQHAQNSEPAQSFGPSRSHIGHCGIPPLTQPSQTPNNPAINEQRYSSSTGRRKANTARLKAIIQDNLELNQKGEGITQAKQPLSSSPGQQLLSLKRTVVSQVQRQTKEQKNQKHQHNEREQEHTQHVGARLQSLSTQQAAARQQGAARQQAAVEQQAAAQRQTNAQRQIAAHQIGGIEQEIHMAGRYESQQSHPPASMSIQNYHHHYASQVYQQQYGLQPGQDFLAQHPYSASLDQQQLYWVYNENVGYGQYQTPGMSMMYTNGQPAMDNPVYNNQYYPGRPIFADQNPLPQPNQTFPVLSQPLTGRNRDEQIEIEHNTTEEIAKRMKPEEE